MHHPDTIVAIATAPQNGAIGIIRLSGPEAKSVLGKIFFTHSKKNFSASKPRYFHFGELLDSNKNLIDEALAVFMPGPATFTGEDVVEIHCHGNLILLKKVIALILDLSSDFDLRAAEPGEFSKRAYLNGRLDLTQAEAIHDIISASSEQSLALSLANLDKRLSTAVIELKEQLKVSLALVEASFEFPEEDIQTFDIGELIKTVSHCQEILKGFESAFHTSKLYDQGITVALVGKPNVGKSSLLNALLFEDRAIVSDIPGTTRDVVEGHKIIRGIRFLFRDTAGLRNADDQIETLGIKKTLDLIDKSDFILSILDDPSDDTSLQLSNSLPKHKTLVVLNKADLYIEPGLFLDETSTNTLTAKFPQFDYFISAKQRFGLSELEDGLFSLTQNKSVHNFVHINERQYRNICMALEVLETILNDYASNDNFVSEEITSENLRYTIKILNEITGEISSDEVLGEIFSRFCIGK